MTKVRDRDSDIGKCEMCIDKEMHYEAGMTSILGQNLNGITLTILEQR